MKDLRVVYGSIKLFLRGDEMVDEIVIVWNSQEDRYDYEVISGDGCHQGSVVALVVGPSKVKSREMIKAAIAMVCVEEQSELTIDDFVWSTLCDGVAIYRRIEE